MLLVDTAGIRRRGLTKGVEQYSLLRGLRAMERADIGIVVIDAKDGITAQDVHIAGYVVEAGRGLILVLNKWDLLTAEEKEEKVWRRQIKQALSFAPWAPISYVSAKTGQRVAQPLEVALKVVEERRRRVATPELNKWLRTLLGQREPPTRKGKRLKMLYVTQAEAMTPTFVLLSLPHLQDWNAQTKTAAAVGKGSIDWKKVFTAAKTGGVRNYFVEQDMEMTKEGVAFLKALNV